MTSTDQDRLLCGLPINRLAWRNAHIYASDDCETVLGVLWVAEGVINTCCYSMVETLCIFTDTFNLQDDSQRLVGRDEQPPLPGNYYIITNGRSSPCFGHQLLTPDRYYHYHQGSPSTSYTCTVHRNPCSIIFSLCAWPGPAMRYNWQVSSNWWCCLVGWLRSRSCVSFSIWAVFPTVPSGRQGTRVL